MYDIVIPYGAENKLFYLFFYFILSSYHPMSIQEKRFLLKLYKKCILADRERAEGGGNYFNGRNNNKCLLYNFHPSLSLFPHPDYNYSQMTIVKHRNKDQILPVRKAGRPRKRPKIPLSESGVFFSLCTFSLTI